MLRDCSFLSYSVSVGVALFCIGMGSFLSSRGDQMKKGNDCGSCLLTCVAVHTSIRKKRKKMG